MSVEQLRKEAKEILKEIMRAELKADMSKTYESYKAAEEINLKAAKIQRELLKEDHDAKKTLLTINYNNSAIHFETSAKHYHDKAEKVKTASKLIKGENKMDKILVAKQLVKLAKMLMADDLSPAQKEYQNFFEDKMEDAEISSPKDLETDKDKKEFFDDVSDSWAKE